MISNKAKLFLGTLGLIAVYLGIVMGFGVDPQTAIQFEFLAFAAIPASLATFGYVFRYLIRERQFLGRLRRNKLRTASEAERLPTYKGRTLEVDPEDLIWYEFQPRSLSAERSKISIDALTQTVMTLDTNVGSTPSEVRSRPIHSLVERRAEDGTTSVFFGTSRMDADSAMQTFAASAGYSAVTMDGPPPVGIEGGYTIASRPKRIDHMSVSEVGREVNGTLRALSGSRENSFVGNIVLTFEGPRDFEVKRFMAFSNEQAIEYGGETNKAAGGSTSSGGIGGKTSTVAHSMLRATLTITADSTSGESSRSAFSTVSRSMSSLPLIMRAHEAQPWHRKKSWIVIGSYAGFAALTAVSGILPMWLLALTAAPAIGATIATAVNPPLLVDDVMRRRLLRGYVPVPTASMFSARWFFISIFASFRRNAGSSERVNNEIAWPSVPEVVPFYASPLAEMLMPDTRAVENNQRREKLPFVELEREYEGFSSDADIVVGVTSKKQPVNFSIEDQNLGVAGFGRPNFGKTNLLQIVYLRNAQMSVSRQSEFEVSPIWFENKGDGAYELWKWVRYLPGAELFEVNRPRMASRIALEGPRYGDRDQFGDLIGTEETLSNINNFIDQILTAFGLSGDTTPVALANITSSLTVAALLSEEELREMEIDSEMRHLDRPNLVKLALILLNQSIQLSVTKKLEAMQNNLFKAVNDRDDLPEEEQKRRAALSQHLGVLTYYQNRRDGNEATNSAATRLRQLAECPLFEPLPGQKEISIGEIIERRKPSIINFAAYLDKDKSGKAKYRQPNSQDLVGIVMRMVQKAYWTHITVNGNGWQKQRKYTQAYADEASQFALPKEDSSGRETNVTMNIADQGRSKGASQMLMTQRYSTSHISPLVREVMTASATFFQFAQIETEDARQAIESLGGEESVPFSKENILKMKLGVSLAYLNRNSERTNVVTLMTPPLEAIAGAIIDPKNPTKPVSAQSIYQAMLDYYSRLAAQKKRQRRDVGDRELPTAERRQISSNRL